MKRAYSDSKGARIRINTVITGEPAKWLDEWKRRGLVNSYTDAIIQAIRAFNEKVIEQDLKSAQLGNIQRAENW